MTSTPRPAAAPPGRAVVDDITTLVLAPDVEAAAAVLDRLADQTTTPGRVLLAGLDPAAPGAEGILDHPLARQRRVPVLLRPGPTGADARRALVEDARASLPVHEGHWIWFLAPDSRPEPGALTALAAAVRRSSRVGVVGPKLVRDDDPRVLRALGHHLTPAGRATDVGTSALVDQGQLDLRQDVLGVPLAGALVNSQVLSEVGGVDPAFGADGVDGLDLCWRAHLAGHRVVVAPDAVVRQGARGLGVVDPLRTRVRQRQLALARGPFWAAPWRALGVLVTSTLAALLLLLVKRPAEAAGEWADVRAVLSPARGWAARRRFRRRRAVRPRDLAGLHGPAGAGWRTTGDTVLDALDPRARPSSSGARRDGSTETGPVSDEFAALAGEGHRGRRGWAPAVALLAAVLLTGWVWHAAGLLGALRPGGMGVVGPELGPAPTGAAGTWASLLDGWRGGGLGHAGAPEPWLLPASALTALAQLLGAEPRTALAPTLAWVLALAAPASVLTAYLALRRSTRLRWPRAALALGWAGLAPLTGAVADGRVGPVAVHVLAPLLLAGYAVCWAPGRGVRRTAAVFATALGVVLAGMWVPPVVLLAAAAGLVLLALGPRGARWRGAVLAVVPGLLLAPWLVELWRHPLRLLGGAGASVASPTAPLPVAPWELMLLDPTGQRDVVGGLPLWAAALLWVAALAALLLPGRGGRAGVLVGAAVTCLALALVAVRTGLGVLPSPSRQAGQVVLMWPGTLLSLSGAALLLAAGLLVDRLVGDREEGAPRGEAPARQPRSVLAGRVAAVAVLLPLAALVVTPLLPSRGPATLTLGADPLPAVAAEQARGPSALRTLVLEPGEGSAVRVDLLGAEPEPGRVLRDRTDELDGPAVDPAPAVDVVTGLVQGGPPDEVGASVSALGVGYVLLRTDGEHPLVHQVDRVSGLARVSSPPDLVLWRVTGQDGGRIRLVDEQGVVLRPVEVEGPHARARVDLEGVPAGASLVVAEGAGWVEEVEITVAGEPVVPTAAASGAAVPLPEGEVEVRIEPRRPTAVWLAGSALLGLVVLFLALPFGRAEQEGRV